MVGPNGNLVTLLLRPQDTTLYSCVGKAGFFERVESAAELEEDLHSIVESGLFWEAQCVSIIL